MVKNKRGGHYLFFLKKDLYNNQPYITTHYFTQTILSIIYIVQRRKYALLGAARQ